MLLTILVTCPTELDGHYMEIYREAMLRWNRAGLAETQVILLPQGPLSMDVGPFEVVEVEFPCAGGYPIWDVMRSIRAAWPRVKGKYVSVDHPEFLWGPGRLDRTIAWLKGYRPIYAMGNLRRPGDRDERDSGSSKSASDWLLSFIERGLWDDGAIPCFEHIQSCHWMYWAAPQPPGPNPWIEDVFYADKEWLDLWGFARIEREMPFQDVYDLLQVSHRFMAHYKVQQKCVRMPQRVNRLLHLWHPRAWGSWTPELRDWFLSQPERWKGTRFLDRETWDELIEFRGKPQADCEPVGRFRFAVDGTAFNFGLDVCDWLNFENGKEKLKRYYAEREDRLLR